MKSTTNSIFTILFFLIMPYVGFSQEKVFHNQAPPQNNPEASQPYYVLIESSTYNKLYRIRNFCERLNKIAGYCYWGTGNTIIVKDFTGKKEAKRFITTIESLEILDGKKAVYISKKVYEKNTNCDFTKFF